MSLDSQAFPVVPILSSPISLMIGKINQSGKGSDISQLRSWAKGELQKILQISGISVKDMDAILAPIEGTESVGVLREKVLGAYETCLALPINIDVGDLPRTLRDDAQMRIAMRALRSSPDFEKFKGEKIWFEKGGDIRDVLMKAVCLEKHNWYQILARILRFVNPRVMSNPGIIPVDVLRNFLCDYVFCVPRGWFIGKPRGRPSTETAISKERPKFPGIPEEKTATYEDLLSWLRTSENDDLVDAFVDKVRRIKSDARHDRGHALSTALLDGFREGFLGRAVLELALYFYPGILLQDFIAAIRPPELQESQESQDLLPASISIAPFVPTKRPEQTAEKPKSGKFVVRLHHRTSSSILVVADAPPASSLPKIVVPVHREFPEFTSFEHAKEWLRSQANLAEICQEAMKLENEIKLQGFLVLKSNLLFQILLTIKKNFSYATITNILNEIFPEWKREESGDGVSSEDDTEEPIETPEGAYRAKLLEIQKNSAGMDFIRTMCSHHHQGRYGEFIAARTLLGESEDTIDFWNALYDLYESMIKYETEKHAQNTEPNKPEKPEKILFDDFLFDLVGQKISPEEKLLYTTKYTWKERIPALVFEKKPREELLGLFMIGKLSPLIDALRAIKIQMPLNLLLSKDGWRAWQEKVSADTDLYAILEKLILKDQSGQAGSYDMDIKDLKHKLRQVLGLH